jgi:hypothetical protein
MLEKLAGGAPVGSVQLNRKSDAPLFPRVKATPSVTEYLLVLTSVVTACAIVASMRKLDAMPYWINCGYVLFFMVLRIA